MKNTVRFLIFTFLLTYVSHGVLAYLTRQNILDFTSIAAQVLFIIGGSSPTIFAFIFILRNPEMKNTFFKRLLSVKHKYSLWIFVILTPLALAGFFRLTYNLINNEVFQSPYPFYLFPVFLLISVIFGGLEEVGWRGYLQENLMKSKSLIPISITIGIIWGIWHLPMFFIEALSHYQYDLFTFMLGGIMYSIYLTWLYAKTKSILLTVLFHAVINAGANIGLSLVFDGSLLSISLIVILSLIGFGLLYYSEYNHQEVNNEI